MLINHADISFLIESRPSQTYIIVIHLFFVIHVFRFQGKILLLLFSTFLFFNIFINYFFKVDKDVVVKVE